MSSKEKATDNPFVVTPEVSQALRDEYGKGATDSQWLIFIAMCERRKLRPCEAGGVHFTLRNAWEYDEDLNRKVKVKKVAYVTGIGALQTIAERTGKYKGKLATKFVYLDDNSLPTLEYTRPIPNSQAHRFWGAEVTVKQQDREDTVFFARFDAYVVTYKKDNVEHISSMWEKRGPEQTAKCAFAGALREAFPEDLSDLYGEEEMERLMAESKVIEKETEAPADSKHKSVVTVELPPTQIPTALNTAPAIAGGSKPAEDAPRPAITKIPDSPTTRNTETMPKIIEGNAPSFSIPSPAAELIFDAATSGQSEKVDTSALQPHSVDVPKVEAPAPAVIEVKENVSLSVPATGEPPTGEQKTKYLLRARDLVNELTIAGLKSTAGRSATARMKKFVMFCSDADDLNKVTASQWESVLDMLDKIMAEGTDGKKRAIDLIESKVS